jgi:two-component system NarL family sensor kinase
MSDELHNGIQSLIVAAGMGINAVVRQDEMPKNELDMLKDSAKLLKQAISETRSVSHNIIPDLIKTHGLENYLNLIVNTVRSSTDITFDLSIHLGEDPLQNQLQIYLCRLVQEMISNTLKHAKATTVLIKIIRKKEEIHVDFQDDGIGFNAHQHTEGIGLQSVRKKVKELNGQ